MKNSRHSFIFCFVFFLFPCITNGQNESFLLVMDMQEIWTKQADNTNNSQNLIDRVNEAITKTNPEKVIYVESLAAELQLSFSGLSLEIKPGLNLDDRLTFVGNTQVMKGRANAFTSEQLQTFINESGASDFTLVGLMAEHCVKETALLHWAVSKKVIP